jgi:hypothetical protein
LEQEAEKTRQRRELLRRDRFKTRTQQLNQPEDQMIQLKLDDTTFCVSRTVFENDAPSVFTYLMARLDEGSLNMTDNDEIRLEMCADAFKEVLQWLRFGLVPTPTAELLYLARFLSLRGLVKALGGEELCDTDEEEDREGQEVEDARVGRTVHPQPRCQPRQRVIIRATYEGDTRRLHLLPDVTFGLLRGALVKRYGLEHEVVALRFKDEEGCQWYSLSTDDDLADALSFNANQPSRLATLHIRIQRVTQPSVEPGEATGERNHAELPLERCVCCIY